MNLRHLRHLSLMFFSCTTKLFGLMVSCDRSLFHGGIILLLPTGCQRFFNRRRVSPFRTIILSPPFDGRGLGAARNCELTVL